LKLFHENLSKREDCGPVGGNERFKTERSETESFVNENLFLSYSIGYEDGDFDDIGAALGKYAMRCYYQGWLDKNFQLGQWVLNVESVKCRFFDDFNFDDDKKYYIMCKDADWGLGTSLIYAPTRTSVKWADMLSPDTKWYGDSAAWKMLYNPENGHYLFMNAKFGYVLSHPSSGVRMYNRASPEKWTDDEYFQLMPDRRDITISAGDESITTHGYWFTWTVGTTFRSLVFTKSTTDPISFATFNYSDDATKQQYIIIPEEELPKWKKIAQITAINNTKADIKVHEAKKGKFIENGRIVIYKDGKKYSSSGQQVK
jgi:hypothetical protein